ncbi:MAG: ferrous iron transport protein A [Roseburia sp.]|nr:ferrous iron transport protein A [Roseburia sp.]
MTLDELQIGRKAVIVGVGGEGALRCRLLDMGLIPRTEVEVRKVAPMGDPIEIRIRGYELTIRKEDAKEIEIETVEEKNPLLLHGQSHFASQNKEDL